MTTTVIVSNPSHPVNVTTIRKQSTGDERSSTEKIPSGQTKEFFVTDATAIRIDEQPYEAPATDR